MRPAATVTAPATTPAAALAALRRAKAVALKCTDIYAAGDHVHAAASIAARRNRAYARAADLWLDARTDLGLPAAIRSAKWHGLRTMLGKYVRRVELAHTAICEAHDSLSTRELRHPAPRGVPALPADVPPPF